MIRARYLCSVAATALAAVSLHAVDTDQAIRLPLKEPVYKSKSPKYCLLVLGTSPSQKIWLVLDGDILYADRNGNGDLTEAGEQKRAVSSILPAGRLFEFGNLAQLQGKKVHLTVARNDGKDESDHLSLSVGGKEFQTVISEKQPFKFTTRPQDAPVIHCAGPLSMALRVETVLVRGREQGFYAMIGTPSLGGEPFAAVTTNWVPNTVHPVAEFEFASRQPGGKPIKVSCQLDQRCCGINFYGLVQVPDEAAGDARVTLSFPDWNENVVAPVTVSVPVRDREQP